MGVLKRKAIAIVRRVARATGLPHNSLFDELFSDPEEFAARYDAYLTGDDKTVIAGPDIR